MYISQPHPVAPGLLSAVAARGRSETVPLSTRSKTPPNNATLHIVGTLCHADSN